MGFVVNSELRKYTRGRLVVGSTISSECGMRTERVRSSVRRASCLQSEIQCKESILSAVAPIATPTDYLVA